tara:strand:- start:321 stop:692 length:372 start_codon:yes stop_codon:yes gene_type:complete
MIDKNDAPEGYEAVEQGDKNCKGCAFNASNDCLYNKRIICVSNDREDGQEVIFRKRVSEYSHIEGRTIESLGYCEETGSWEMLLSDDMRLVFDVFSQCDHDGFCECLDSLVKLDVQNLGGNDK